VPSRTRIDAARPNSSIRGLARAISIQDETTSLLSSQISAALCFIDLEIGKREWPARCHLMSKKLFHPKS
jgi:hypothetical protein